MGLQIYGRFIAQLVVALHELVDSQGRVIARVELPQIHAILETPSLNLNLVQNRLELQVGA